MIYDAGENVKEAYLVAKGLGGLGVTAYVKETNGKDYVIIKNYKKYKLDKSEKKEETKMKEKKD